MKFSPFAVLFSLLLCLFVLTILNTRVLASLAQWLEHLSCKTGVRVHISHRAAIFLLSSRIDAPMMFKFIYSATDWCAFDSVRLFINILSQQFVLSL